MIPDAKCCSIDMKIQVTIGFDLMETMVNFV